MRPLSTFFFLLHTRLSFFAPLLSRLSPAYQRQSRGDKKTAHQRHETDERRLALDESVLGALCLDVDEIDDDAAAVADLRYAFLVAEGLLLPLFPFSLLRRRKEQGTSALAWSNRRSQARKSELFLLPFFNLTPTPHPSLFLRLPPCFQADPSPASSSSCRRRSSSSSLPPLLDPGRHRRDDGDHPVPGARGRRLFPGRKLGVARVGGGRRGAGARARRGRRGRLRGQDLRQWRRLGATPGVGRGQARGGGARGGV